MQDEFDERPLRATGAAPTNDTARDEAIAEIRGLQEGLAQRVAMARHRQRGNATDAGAAGREPVDLYHSIALGTVLAGRGLRAADSWRLDGLLSGSVEQFTAWMLEAAAAMPGKAIGAVLVRMIDNNAPALEAKGRMAAWRRKYRQYQEEHGRWMAPDREHRENGAWRAKQMSAGQVELIRITAGLLEIDIPGHLDRGHAHDWLQAKGANLRYRRLPE